jgi:hypothetical protein
VNPEWLATLTALKQRGVSTTVLLLNQEDFGGMALHRPIRSQLDTWGIRHYLINKNIYTQPKSQDFLPNLGLAPSRNGDKRNGGSG